MDEDEWDLSEPVPSAAAGWYRAAGSEGFTSDPAQAEHAVRNYAADCLVTSSAPASITSLQV